MLSANDCGNLSKYFFLLSHSNKIRYNKRGIISAVQSSIKRREIVQSKKCRPIRNTTGFFTYFLSCKIMSKFHIYEIAKP